MMTTYNDSGYFYNSVKNLMGVTTNKILDIVFINNGFVAGGFPRFMRRNATQEGVRTYFGQNSGDIDVFFKDKQSQTEACKMILDDKTISCKMAKSWGKHADNVEFYEKFPHSNPEYYGSRVTIQLIDCRLGMPGEILSSFDMRNSMIGYNPDSFWIDDKFSEIEDQKLIDVANWKTDFVPWRIAKYMRKYDYVGVTQETKQKLAPWILERYNEKLNKAASGLVSGLDNSTIQDFQGFVNSVLKLKFKNTNENFLSDDDLLLLTFVFANKKVESLSDNIAFKELLKRHKISRKAEAYSNHY